MSGERPDEGSQNAPAERAPARGAPIRPRRAWARERLRVPELDRLLDAPLGARITDQFDSLRVRLVKGVERIEEHGQAAAAELARRAAILRIVALSSATIGIVAATAALTVPAFRLVGTLLAVGEGIAVVVLARRQAGLVHDLAAALDLASRFRGDLEAARTSDDLHRLVERIRAETVAALGEPPSKSHSEAPRNSTPTDATTN